ncbi:acetyltransferase [Candidatus Marinimicrobia bacterium]|nr:acetyltransferase [Candidatus Neomarinimicrobiota bacterium]
MCIYGLGGGGKEALSFFFDSIKTNGNYSKRDVVFMVDDAFYFKKKIMGVRVIKKSTFDPNYYKVVVAVHDPVKRKKMVKSLPDETIFTKIIHPSAIISKWVDVGEGSIIGPSAILTTNIKIGNHAIINLGVTIGHDCSISDYFTAEPASNISGNCNISKCVYLGTNSSVKENTFIQKNVIIGMGGVVIKDIKQSGTFVGNPLKKI